MATDRELQSILSSGEITSQYIGGTSIDNKVIVKSDLVSLEEKSAIIDANTAAIGALEARNLPLTEPTGFNRSDKTTLPLLELCGADTTEYRRIYYNEVSGEVEAINISGQTTYSDGTPLAQTTLRIIPTTNPSGCYYYYRGSKVDIVAESININPTVVSGGKVTYYDEVGDLKAVSDPDAPTIKNIIENYVVISICTCDATSREIILMADEMHSFIMPGATHASKHLTDGCKYGYGLQISGLVNNGDSYTSIAAGQCVDEDIYVNAAASTTSRFWYRGAAGEWKQSANKDNKLGHQVGGEVQYNLKTGNDYSLENINDDYVVMHFLFTNDLLEPIKKVIGQNLYTDRNTARERLEGEISQLQLDGLPSPEFVFLYSMIIHGDGEGQIETGADGEIYIDHRFGYPVGRYV